jgi:hypothetical protein
MLQKYRSTVFRIVKRLYEQEVLSFDNTLEGLQSYNEAYTKISGLLDSINATKRDIEIYLNETFLEWYLKGYDKIVAKFLDEEI